MSDVAEHDFARVLQEALDLDAKDPLAALAQHFPKPKGGIYLDGNSLGLISDTARARVQTMLDEWENEAISAWKTDGWFDLAERLGDRVGALIGAQPGETIVTGSTTTNLHQLLATFCQPAGGRQCILADATAFPTDLHAIRSHLRLRGSTEDVCLVLPDENGWLDPETILEKMDETIALAVLPTVVYTTGQLLDLRRITAGAKERGVRILWDASHSIGAVPHRFGEDGIEFAFWCSYKYLNGGPGAAGGLFVSKQLSKTFLPGLAGWWGGRKDRLFAMSGLHEPAPGAAGLQLGTPNLLSMAALDGSLTLFEEAGMRRLREKSLALTAFLRRLIGIYLPECRVITPFPDDQRGGHLAIHHPAARELCLHLRQTGQMIGDFRPPDTFRLAPVAFYNRYADLVHATARIRQTLDRADYLEKNISAVPMVT